jgi:hypothetical protein
MMILMGVTILKILSTVERMEMEEKIHTVTKDGKPVFPYVGDINFKRFKK